VNSNNPFYPIGQIFSRLWSKGNQYYNWGFNMIDASTKFNNWANEDEKLKAILSNPAAMKVFALQCDLFSMGKLFVYDKNEKPIENDPFLEMIKKPNHFQTESQFLWDYMFYLMLGTDYIYADSKVVSNKNKLYHLNPAKIHWPENLNRYKDKLILSDASMRDLMKMEITYRYQYGDTQKIPLEKIIVNTDLTNGTGNWWIGASRVDALYKIISNAEFVLDAENINIRYSGKFVVGAQNDLSKIGFGETEKEDLLSKVDTNEQKVWAFKSPIQIRRFVDNFAQLQLKDEYLHLYFLIGNMYGIPRDVLEAYNSATYENQEKARAAHVNYCFEPKGNQLMDSFESYFGYDKEGKNIYIDWSHMPFMQQFEKQRAEVEQLKINSLTSLLSLGVDIKQANEYLDTNFKIKKPKEETKPQQNEQESQPPPNETEQEEQGEGTEEESNS
jgi:hypothetical protein